MPNVLLAISAKDFADARRERFVLIVTAFLTIAALTALISGAVALATDVATYNASRDTLLALGKSAADIKAPEFYPLRLLRGAIEQIEIIGAIIAILIGYRGAASERGRQTLALMLSRPIARWQFIAGKALAGIGLIAGGLALVLITCTIALNFISGVGLTGDDLVRVGVIWVAGTLYAGTFFLLAFAFGLSFRRLPSALLASFIVWLLIVLVAPQIGDTLDPDNQVAGGVFKQLQIVKADEKAIMQTFASYETIREGIEAASITKHFEQLSFATLGIKATYAGQPLSFIMADKIHNIIWLIAAFFMMGGVVLALPLDPSRLSEE